MSADDEAVTAPSPPPPQLLTDAQLALLRRYYQSAHLTPAQKDRLVVLYWCGSREERAQIASVYAHLFATDGTFIQRLMAYHDERAAATEGQQQQQPLSPASPLAATVDPGPTFAHPPAVGANHHAGGARRLTHAQRLLRSSIAEQYPQLTADRQPFFLRFEVVATEVQKKEVVDLYSSQFVSPEPADLQHLVQFPKSVSTRTRRQVKGSYTWLLRLLDARPPRAVDEDPAEEAKRPHPGKVICAATIVAHTHHTHKFAELPLFATAAGYKKNGLARLLHAALARWCARASLEFLMLSADVQAVAFWDHLGYMQMSRTDLSRIDYVYHHECCTFTGTTLMVMYTSARYVYYNDATGQYELPAAAAPPPPTEGKDEADGTGDGAKRVKVETAEGGPPPPLDARADETRMTAAAPPPPADGGEVKEVPVEVTLEQQTVEGVLAQLSKTFIFVGPSELPDI
ncbi:hypothetical protein STCU_02976 [Strigomonas culicis]|uniref:Increased DNA methylation 1 C-terminal domain-containing protein n=1 Tax=Strigomonas culicis TaxID=28005 RepID=S9W8I1_9TRYP|nr:hypothetical protein STCU_02976 [Strigomonas culicis]|eukprot:EPY32100.1 hypothetical protein STCU_02976 [Strigomonas culicis]